MADVAMSSGTLHNLTLSYRLLVFVPEHCVAMEPNLALLVSVYDTANITCCHCGLFINLPFKTVVSLMTLVSLHLTGRVVGGLVWGRYSTCPCHLLLATNV